MPRSARSPRRASRHLVIARLLLAFGATVVGTSVGAIAASAPAYAHTELRSSTPANGASLATPPTEVRLVFSEAPVASPLEVAVTLAGKVQPTGSARLDGTAVVLPVTLSDPGTYTVAYRVVSDDGHPVQGVIRFGLAGSPTPSATPSASAAAPSSATPTATPGPVPPAEDRSWWPYVVIGAVIIILVVIGTVLATAKRPPKRSMD